MEEIKNPMLIGRAWEQLCNDVMPGGVPMIQLIEMRRAFYAGALMVMDVVGRISPKDMEEGTGGFILGSMREELIEFGEAIGNGKA